MVIAEKLSEIFKREPAEPSDREGQSSVFRRKMRPRSGMQAPQYMRTAIPSAARSSLGDPSGDALGRDREGQSSVFRRKMRPRSRMQALQYMRSAIPSAARSSLVDPSGDALGRPLRSAVQSLKNEII
ncbi:hypothetical protein SAMN05216387_105168 [Nitrosovibrio tenuis]|uniref:Uncharacterized protein n=1 Tax=Nitrosovibrio tenuis TaxID=1233 RepID=A0A1H7MPR8_9PROT|nr:hypothetical protein SAMN05216387_105168 [Nitrosovibrio tenuis]